MGFHKATIVSGAKPGSTNGGLNGGLLGAAPLKLGEEADSSGYRKGMAKTLMTLAGWSYSDQDTFKEKIAPISQDMRSSNFLEITVTNQPMLVVASAQMIRSKDKKTIYICFRGTKMVDVVNWMTDAGTRQTEFGRSAMNVHTGFLRNTQEVWNGYKGIEEHLKKPFMLDEDFKAKDYDNDTTEWDDPKSEQHLLENIYITGHSLGGGMAVIAGLLLKELCEKEKESSWQKDYSILWDKLRGIYTYGQPMVIGVRDRVFCDTRIGEKLYRHVYFNDIVPHLPPLSTGAFDHIGAEYRFWPKNREFEKREAIEIPFFGKLDNVIVRPRTTQVPSILFTAPFAILDAIVYNIQWTRFLKMPWSLQDHSPISYMAAFEEHPGPRPLCPIL
jgi:hypothetical protein